MYEDFAEYAINCAQNFGAEYAEARLEHVQGKNFVLKNGILEGSSFVDFYGLGVRFFVGGKLGFISTNKFDRDCIKELIERAIKGLTYSKMSQRTQLAPANVLKKRYSVSQKIKLLELDVSEYIKLLEDIERAIRACACNPINRYLSLSSSFKNKLYINTDGSQIEAKIPRIGFWYIITLEENGKTAQRCWQYGAACGWEGIKNWALTDRLPAELESIQKVLKEGIRPPTGKLDIVVSPEITGIMVHESAGHPYEADRILGREAAQAGESFINPDMIGNQIGSEIVNVIDDPTLAHSYGFYLVDDEGVRARRKYLIKDGKINELLHNRETAAIFGLQSNGSARASAYDKEPIIRMSNTFMLPGDCTEEELIEGVKKGIYMKNFMEWNIDDRRWNQKYVGCEAYLIEHGKLTKPVLNPSIELTTAKLYSSIDAIGKNLELHAATCGKGEPMQGIPVLHGGPAIRIREVRLI